ncbi:hypothetical protein [Fimbriiglobus ruber]|uniref:Uncharacterized protein n=1 Tax=Fimbriiglobus ruber TaxID=1908690 RepID=A0A225E679_9BACT|nr:hypothetical protein [Fimbriiglobus ruber]OWK47274.1 hypothetical protein FRUB_00973 [Fimbriiglobus ruber]
MARKETASQVPLEQRKAIFLALVEAQDKGQSVEESRVTAAKQFEVTETQVKAIEREGLDNEWPPL